MPIQMGSRITKCISPLVCQSRWWQDCEKYFTLIWSFGYENCGLELLNIDLKSHMLQYKCIFLIVASIYRLHQCLNMSKNDSISYNEHMKTVYEVKITYIN